MEMLGVRSRQRNMSNPPEKCREKRGRQHLIANAQGDLDAYVVHFDYPRSSAHQGSLSSGMVSAGECTHFCHL